MSNYVYSCGHGLGNLGDSGAPVAVVHDPMASRSTAEPAAQGQAVSAATRQTCRPERLYLPPEGVETTEIKPRMRGFFFRPADYSRNYFNAIADPPIDLEQTGKPLSIRDSEIEFAQADAAPDTLAPDGGATPAGLFFRPQSARPKPAGTAASAPQKARGTYTAFRSCSDNAWQRV